MVGVISSSKKTLKNKQPRKGSDLIQVVSFFVPIFCPVFSGPLRSGSQSFTEEQRNDFTSDTARGVTERHNRCPFTSTIIPVTSHAYKYGTFFLPWRSVTLRHTWTPVPWRCSIWALIVCMLLMIFFWWPTSVIPKFKTSLGDRRTHQSMDLTTVREETILICRLSFFIIVSKGTKSKS